MTRNYFTITVYDTCLQQCNPWKSSKISRFAALALEIENRDVGNESFGLFSF